jgi:hypothetical protein
MTGARYVPVTHPATGKLLFRYDPVRQIVEWQERGEKVYLDLAELAAACAAARPVTGRAETPTGANPTGKDQA